MVKFVIFTLIFILVVSTTLIKNSTKENLVFLENRFKDTKLELDYLSSSEKLLEYQFLYFENSLQEKSLKELNTLKIIDNDLIINQLTILDNKNEQ